MISGCNSLEHYTGKKPKMDFKEFYTGKVIGKGMVFDYKGRQIRTFDVVTNGTVDGDKLIMYERCDFNDGGILDRTWDIEFKKDGKFTATTSDVIGIARGDQKGNAARVDYTMRIEYKNSTIDVKLDDWTYLIDKNTAINRAKMKKFGIKVGEFIIFLKKEDIDRGKK